MIGGLITTWALRLKPIAILVAPFLWAACLFIFMNMTSPLKSGPLSVLLAFSLIYLVAVSFLYALTLVAWKAIQFFGRPVPVSRKQTYYLVSVIGFGPVFMLALNTLGQLEVKEVLLVMILLTIGCFYVLRRSKKQAA